MKYIFLFALILGFVSCGKDDPQPQGPTKTDMITVAAWKYDNGGADSNGDGTIDFTFEQTGVVQPCRLDNSALFKTDGSGVTDEGATKCNSTDPQTTPFNWNFMNNESVIFVTGSGFFGFGGQFKVKTLTSNNLTVTKDTTLNYLGTQLPVTVIANLKH